MSSAPLLVARIGNGTYQYVEDQFGWTSHGSLEQEWPEYSPLALISVADEGAARWGNAEGVVSYLDLAGKRIGLICTLGAPGEPEIELPVTFALSDSSAEKLKAKSPRWWDHLHTRCRGRLVISDAPGGVTWSLTEQQGRDSQRIEEVLRKSLAAKGSSFEAWAAGLSLRALAGYLVALGLRLFELPGRPAAELRFEKPPGGVMEAVRHLVLCDQCSSGHICATGAGGVLKLTGDGQLLRRLQLAVHRRQKLRGESRDHVSLGTPARSPTLRARLGDGLAAYDAQQRRWSLDFSTVSTGGWPHGAPFALYSAELAQPRWYGGDSPLITYVNVSQRLIGLLLQLSSSEGTELALPVLLPLDSSSIASLGGDPDLWRQLTQRRCQGRVLRDSETGVVAWRFEEVGDPDPEQLASSLQQALARREGGDSDSAWAGDAVASTLRGFWVGLGLLLLGSRHASGSLKYEAPADGIEELVRHLSACRSVSQGDECPDCSHLAKRVQPSGPGAAEIVRLIATRSERIRTPRLLVRVGTEIAAYDSDLRRWSLEPPQVAPEGWPDEAPFALRSAATARLRWWGGDRPLITYVNVNSRVISLLLTLTSEDDGELDVPVLFRLDDPCVETLGRREDVWHKLSQSRCRGRVVRDQVVVVAWGLDEAAEPEPDRVASSLQRALGAGEEGDPDRAWSAMMVASALRGFWVGLGLRLLGDRLPSGLLRYESPSDGVEDLVRHLSHCNSPSTGDECEDCSRLAEQIRPRGPGAQELTRLVASRSERGKIAEFVEILLAQTDAPVADRVGALEHLRKMPVAELLRASFNLQDRWPMSVSARNGSPWALLGWLVLTLESKPSKRSRGNRDRIEDSEVAETGWDLQKSDRTTPLLVAALKNDRLDEARLLLASMAFAEISGRHSAAVHPEGIKRVLGVLRHYEGQPIWTTGMIAVNRLIKAFISTEARRPVPFVETARRERSHALWDCLRELPLKSRETRNQWVQAYYTFPWVRSLMRREIPELDPDIEGAFRDPIEFPDMTRLTKLAGRNAAGEAGAVGEATFLLSWFWSASAAKGFADGVERPPSPSLDETTVAGSGEYWRQFLWGCWRLGPESRDFWPSFLETMIERNLGHRTENQAWMSAYRWLDLTGGSANTTWAGLVQSRLATVLHDWQGAHDDERPVTLLGVLARVEPDPRTFLDMWLRVEELYSSARVDGAWQRCLNILLVRSDLAALSEHVAFLTRLNAAYFSRNSYIVVGALRARLRAVGLGMAIERILTGSLRASLWAGRGEYWLRKVSTAEPRELRPLVARLLSDLASGEFPASELKDDEGSRLAALRSLLEIDSETAVALLGRMRSPRDLNLARTVLGSTQSLDRETRGKALESHLDACMEVGGEPLGRAVGLAMSLQLEQEQLAGVTLRKLSDTSDEALQRASSAVSAAWLLSGLSALPVGTRPAMDQYEFEIRALISTLNSSSLSPILALLRALACESEPWTPPESAGGSLEAAIAANIQALTEARPSDLVMMLAGDLLRADPSESQVNPITALLALAGIEARLGDPPALTAIIHDSKVIFEAKDITAFRTTLHDYRDRLGIQLDILREARVSSSEQCGLKLSAWATQLSVRKALREALEGLLGESDTEAGLRRFVDLWRLAYLQRLEQVLAIVDSLFHDYAKVESEAQLASYHDELDDELRRLAVYMPRRLERPAEAVGDAVAELIESSRWEDVHMERRRVPIDPMQPEGTAIFDLADYLAVVRNLISNAREHGVGPVRVIVAPDGVEIFSGDRGEVDQSTWEGLARWLNGGGETVPPAGFRLGTGLRAVRRFRTRNPTLHFGIVSGVIAKGPEREEGGIAGDDELRRNLVVAVSWQPPTLEDLGLPT